MKVYVAYGSNLDTEQMAWRCPKAKIISSGMLEGWELIYRRSYSGAYATIRKAPGKYVPVGLWKISAADERALDRYEGFPNFYYKKEMVLDISGIKTGKIRRRRAFVYIMHEDRKIEIPSIGYVRVCLEGYGNFGFDVETLLNAYDHSVEVAK